jgi:hypothetical protein
MTTHYQEGLYKARITGQRFDKTKNNNTVIVLDIMPQVDGSDGQYGRSIQWVVTDKTIDFVVEKLRRVGFAGQSFVELDTTAPKFYDLSGQLIDVYCGHSDKGYEDWDLPRPAAQRSQMPANERQNVTARLDALYGKKLRTGTQTTPRTTPRPAVKPDAELKQEAETADDGVPF